MRVLLIFCIFGLCACASSSKTAKFDGIVRQDSKPENLADLTTAISKLPGVFVQGEGRLAKIHLRRSTCPTFVVNGQVEPYYRQVYDIVQAGELKTVRVENLSDAAVYGLRKGHLSMIIIEVE